MSEEIHTIIERIVEKSLSEAESLLATAQRVAERQIQSAQRRAATRERVAKDELEADISAMLAAAEAEAAALARQAELTCRHELARGIIDSAMDRLARAPRDEAYLAILSRLAAEAADVLDVDRIEIRVSQRDYEFLSEAGRFEEMARRLEAERSVTATLSESRLEASGGLVAVAPGGKVLYYNTFEEVAHRLSADLMEKIAKRIFQVEK